jgi:hypothetical protein
VFNLNYKIKLKILMAQIILDENFENNYDDSDFDINNNNILNYKGYFLENEEEENEEPKYYEFGAHFPYKYLYQKLEILKEEREEEEIKNKIKEEKEYEKNKENNTLQNIIYSFNGSKGKSRNRNNNNEKKNIFTFIPHKNNKNMKEIEIKNDDNKIKEQNNNVTNNIVQNKHKERTFDM